MAPHITAELWERRHGDGAPVHAQPWPIADPALVTVDTVTMVVQVNGKVRDRLEVDAGITEDEADRAGPGVAQGGRGSSAGRAAGKVDRPAPPAGQRRRLTRLVRRIHRRSTPVCSKL